MTLQGNSTNLPTPQCFGFLAQAEVARLGYSTVGSINQGDFPRSSPLKTTLGNTTSTLLLILFRINLEQWPCFLKYYLSCQIYKYLTRNFLKKNAFLSDSLRSFTKFVQCVNCGKMVDNSAENVCSQFLMCH